MHRHPTFLRTLLPTLVLPALLLVSASAQAAELSISNGFRSAAEYTTIGWNFSIHAEGVVTNSGQSLPSTVDLSCIVDVAGETVHCVGELEIGNNIADIRMSAEDDTVGWAIETGAPVLFNQIHKQWSDEVVTRSLAPGWSALDLYFGGQWRLWYYMTDTVEVFERITDMQWEELNVWET